MDEAQDQAPLLTLTPELVAGQKRIGCSCSRSRPSYSTHYLSVSLSRLTLTTHRTEKTRAQPLTTTSHPHHSARQGNKDRSAVHVWNCRRLLHRTTFLVSHPMPYGHWGKANSSLSPCRRSRSPCISSFASWRNPWTGTFFQHEAYILGGECRNYSASSAVMLASCLARRSHRCPAGILKLTFVVLPSFGFPAQMSVVGSSHNPQSR